MLVGVVGECFPAVSPDLDSPEGQPGAGQLCRCGGGVGLRGQPSACPDLSAVHEDWKPQICHPQLPASQLGEQAGRVPVGEGDSGTHCTGPCCSPNSASYPA